jgi:hypothetical protein
MKQSTRKKIYTIDDAITEKGKGKKKYIDRSLEGTAERSKR